MTRTPITAENLDQKTREIEFAENVARRIAGRHGFETLEERGLDSLDFHEIGVADLRNMLVEAFEEGLAVGNPAIGANDQALRVALQALRRAAADLRALGADALADEVINSIHAPLAGVR